MRERETEGERDRERQRQRETDLSSHITLMIYVTDNREIFFKFVQEG